MSCSSCHQTCPESVPVTITQTTIEFDGENAFWHQTIFSRPAGTVTAVGGSYVLITLPYAPVSAKSVTVYRNGSIQKPVDDYAVSGSQVYLTVPAETDDQFLVIWFATTGSVTTGSSAYAVGYIQPFYADPGTGWLVMDGVTAHVKTAYESLWTFLAANTELLVPGSYSGTTFTLKALTSMLYTGSAVATLNCYIKT